MNRLSEFKQNWIRRVGRELSGDLVGDWAGADPPPVNVWRSQFKWRKNFEEKVRQAVASGGICVVGNSASLCVAKVLVIELMSMPWWCDSIVARELPHRIWVPNWISGWGLLVLTGRFHRPIFFDFKLCRNPLGGSRLVTVSRGSRDWPADFDDAQSHME